MPRPDAQLRNPNPEYLRDLLRMANLTQDGAARAIGVAPRTMRSYLSANPKDHADAPYTVQYALEGLARAD